MLLPTLTSRVAPSLLLALACAAPALAADRTVDCDAAVQSPKRGLAVQGTDYPSGITLNQADLNVLAPGVSWYYNWAASTSVLDTSGRMAFLPMAWGRTNDNTNVQAWLNSHPETAVVLSSNEPNLTEQSNTNPTAAAAFIQGTRAVADGRPVLGAHLAAYTNYPGYADSTAYRNALYTALGGNMPATCIHIYDATTGGFGYWSSLWPHQGWGAGQTAPTKVWVKEFNIGSNAATENQVIDYMIHAVDLMERDTRVERYAWWKDRRLTSAKPATHFMLNQTVNGALTNLGTMYVNMPVHDPNLYYGLRPSGTGRLQTERYVNISGFTLPGTINGNVSVGRSEDTSGYLDVDDLDNLEWIDLNIDAPVAGAYQVALRGKRAATGTSTINVLRSGTSLGAITLTTGTAYTTSATVTITLPAGRQTIRLQGANTASNDTSLNWIEFTTPSAPTPAAPTTLASSAVTTTTLTLTWVDASNNETGFKVERALGAGAFTEVATTAANVATLAQTGLTASTAYRYRVRATNTVGDSAYSNVLSVTTLATPDTTPPATPAAPTVGGSAAVPVLSGTTEAGATVRIYEGATQVGMVVANGTGAWTWTVTGLATGSHSLYVTAMDIAGNTSIASPTVTVIVQVAPVAPTTLAASAITGTTLTLTWVDASNNETGFKLERALDGAAFAEIATPTANTTTLAQTGLTVGATYRYRLRATNAVGNSAYSNVYTVTMLSLPAAPTVLATSTVGVTTLTLIWTDGSSNETGFKIERALGAAAFVEVATTALNVATLAQTGLTASTLYRYRVRATNTVGDSAYSNVLSVTTLATPDTTPPATPAAPTVSGMTLSGTTEPGATIRIFVDGSSTELTSVVANGSGAWSWSAGGLPVGSYTIIVRAVDVAGNISNASPSSPVTVVAGGSSGGVSVGGSGGGCGLGGAMVGLLAGLMLMLRQRQRD